MTERSMVVAAVIQREGKYLVCQRPSHKRHGGLWEFPGGKVNSGESHFAAVERELREELGVETLTVGPVLFSIEDPGSSFLIEFLPAEIAGDVQRIEHTEIAWLTAEELATLPLAPSDRRFIEHSGWTQRLLRPGAPP